MFLKRHHTIVDIVAMNTLELPLIEKYLLSIMKIKNQLRRGEFVDLKTAKLFSVFIIKILTAALAGISEGCCEIFRRFSTTRI